jgi:hypothetical protein
MMLASKITLLLPKPKSKLWFPTLLEDINPRNSEKVLFSLTPAQCPIVERLVDCLMFHGRNTGKKCLAIRMVKQAFEIIELMTGKNPIEVPYLLSLGFNHRRH